jgi:hypothetical protein
MVSKRLSLERYAQRACRRSWKLRCFNDPVEITLIEFDALNLMQLESQFRFHRLNRSGPSMRRGECELVVRIETACPSDIRRFAEAMISTGSARHVIVQRLGGRPAGQQPHGAVWTGTVR